MAYVTNEEVVKARQMDLLTYLYSYEPDNLRHVSGNVFCTADHDSLVISNGKWFWFSQGFGGRSALDYLMKVRGMKLPEAVMKLNGCSPTVKPYVPPGTNSEVSAL